MMQLQHTFYYRDLSRWWDKHHDLGGSVYVSCLPWDFFPDPYEDLRNLFLKFADISLKSLEDFHNASVWDNNMPDREIMEDAAKIWFLYENIKDGVGIKYNPQIIHEPWFDRYRVHPGSGRLASMWLAELNSVQCIYTHFDEPVFEPPPYSEKIQDIEGMVLNMFGPTASKMRADIDTYKAFPKNPDNIAYTHARDSEWKWERVRTNTDWEFVRYSEGQSFNESKSMWRSVAIDLWYRLNSHDCDLVHKLKL